MAHRQLSGTGAGIVGYFAAHGTAANLLLVVLLMIGVVTLPNMRTQYFPDVVLDDIQIVTAWDDAGPEDVDSAIVAPLMPGLMAVDGVESSNSVARTGKSVITLNFEPGWDMAQALSDVEGAVAAVTSLPIDVGETRITRRAWRDRVTDVVVSGPVGVDQLARFTDDLVRRLYAAGVTRTTVYGIADPEIDIVVETGALIRENVSLSEIAAAVGAAAQSSPAGDIDAANARLRSGSEKRRSDQIAGIVLRSNPDGSILQLGDLARIDVARVDRDVAFFAHGNPALTIRVDRTAKGDAIALQAEVTKVAAAAMSDLPPDVKIELIRSRTNDISARLSILLQNGVQGLALVLGLLFLFLNARTALWVAAGIPVAMMTALGVMYVFGMTLNMMSLFGLIITLGIVVDDAIVIGEHADYRARHLGETGLTAVINATRGMALPVLSSTITTMIAFWALTAIGGNFGNLLRDIPVTVCAVLAGSTVECFLILPNHLSHALKDRPTTPWYDWPSQQMNRGLAWVRERLVRPLIWLVLEARYPVIAGAIMLLGTQVVMVVNGDVPWRFFNSPEQGSITGNFAMVQGAGRSDTEAQLQELQRATEVVAAGYEEKYGRNPLAYVLTQIGGTSGRGLNGQDTKEPDQLGSISVELIDADLRPYSSSEFVRAVQEEAVNLPLAETVSFEGAGYGPGNDPLDVKLSGTSSTVLKQAAEALKREVSQFPEVSAVQDDLSWDKEELLLDLTPRAQVLGFSIDAVGQILRQRLNGIEAATYSDGPRMASIRIEVPDAEKTADFLQKVLMRAPSGQYVPLADLVSVTRAPGFSKIRRLDGIRTINVTGDIAQEDPARAQVVVDALQTRILPEIASTYQVSWTIAGLAEQEDAFLNDSVVAFTLSLLGIFLTLAWIFSSWTRPLAIMAVIPLGLIGAIWGHYVWDIPMSIFTVVGLIGMSGIIINDAIVLIDAMDEYAATRGLRPAIVDAVCDRLRPVMLTTLTTVLGMAPLLYETSRQAQFLKPTVVTLVYGLGFGVVLVLLVVPALIAAGHDASLSLKAARRALRSGHGRARGAVLGLGALLLVWFAATLGGQLVLGRMPLSALIDVRVPELLAPMTGFAIFAVGAVAMTALVYLATLWGGKRRR